MKNKNIISMAALLIASMGAAQAQIIISEVDPTGSSTSSYGADWFELKNIGASAVDITGWKMDDNHNSFAAADALNGITSIAPGLAVVFIEDTGKTDATLNANFESAWFGGSVPAGFTIGNYGGGSVGLSSSGDAVNIYNASGVLQANVIFGASTTGFTFDNEAGLTGTISQLSATGVNGAFSDGSEVGSPGDVAPVPEPSTIALTGGGVAALLAFQRRNRKS
jgi:hypothetical protein